MISELWSSEELWVGLVVISVWFFSEVLVSCSSLTMFLFSTKLSNLLVLLCSDAKKIPETFARFKMLLFILFSCFLFWALDFYLNVDILFERWNFIPDSSNSLYSNSFIPDSSKYSSHPNRKKEVYFFLCLFQLQISDQVLGRYFYFKIQITCNTW